METTWLYYGLHALDVVHLHCACSAPTTHRLATPSRHLVSPSDPLGRPAWASGMLAVGLSLANFTGAHVHLRGVVQENVAMLQSALLADVRWLSGRHIAPLMHCRALCACRCTHARLPT